MSEEFRIVYAGARRAVGTTGDVVAHIEFSRDETIAWIDVRSSGTGGPMSGQRLTRYDGISWTETPTVEQRDLIERTLEEARAKNVFGPDRKRIESPSYPDQLAMSGVGA